MQNNGSAQAMALSDRVNGIGVREAELKLAFQKLLAARRTEARHVNYTPATWRALERMSPLGVEALIKAAKQQLVVIEVDGRPLRGFEATQKQIDYINKRVTFR